MFILIPVPSVCTRVTRSPPLSVPAFSNKNIRRYPVTRASSSSSSFNLRSTAAAVSGIIAAVVVISSASAAVAFEPPPLDAETLSNVPQTLSGEYAAASDCRKARIQKPKSRKAESCTVKCVTTCIRGGDGSPGEGLLNIRRPLVVFKQGFRSRNYCLVECSDICNLIGDGDYGP